MKERSLKGLGRPLRIGRGQYLDFWFVVWKVHRSGHGGVSNIGRSLVTLPNMTGIISQLENYGALQTRLVQPIGNQTIGLLGVGVIMQSRYPVKDQRPYLCSIVFLACHISQLVPDL